MSHARFYAPDLEAGAGTVRLPLDEARHLVRVLRLRPGDPVRVFDGRGVECAGRVATIAKDEVIVGVEGRVAAASEARTAITLAQAVLKGDSMDGVVRDAVMLGVTAILPILTAHIEGDRRGHSAGTRRSRWERIAVASAKQCGRAVVPAIWQPMSLAACLPAVPAALRIVLVEPTVEIPPLMFQATGGELPESVLLFVGPEGGWTGEELGLLSGYQARALTLGRRTLRAESAAIVGLSVLHTLAGEFDPGA